MLNISIIIVSWNTKGILRDCLKSVYEQTVGIEFETIVIDNASVDGSSAMVKAEFPKVKLIENSDNRGFAAANNQGIAIAEGEYILLLNSDTVVLDNAIAKTLEFAKKNTQAGAIGCRVLNADKTLQPSCFMFPSLLNMILSVTYLYKIFPRNKFFAREKMGWWDRDDIREVDAVTGCYMLIKRQVLDKAGLLDEDYFIYGEETDLCYRFKKIGCKNLFFNKAQIIHLGGASSKQIKPVMQLQLRASILLFYFKHKAYITYMLACLMTAMFFLIRVPYWFAKSILPVGGRDAAWVVCKTYFSGFLKSFLGYKALCLKR